MQHTCLRHTRADSVADSVANGFANGFANVRADALSGPQL
jgi:hypothetical protein